MLSRPATGMTCSSVMVGAPLTLSGADAKIASDEIVLACE
jgi:hypothetical protein